MEEHLVNDDTTIGGEAEDFNEEMSASESESDEDVKLTEPSKTAVYNRDALLDKLGDISWPENVGWIHTLSIDIDQEQEVDVNDDLTRELAFYNQAFEGTKQAYQKLQSMGLPFLRPPDYYAEMVKTDNHMQKVKGRVLAEKRKMEEAEERRKAREAKRLAKEIQAQKMKERAKQKKQDIESVKKWRKQRQQSGFADNSNDADLGFDFEDGKSFERSKGKRPGVSPGDRSGRKGMKKQNTADTTYDVKGFNKGEGKGNKKRKR
ncbi:hypothetical protein Ahy_B09g096746 isoform A [Arachis hypogaea]|uniref:rRNA-processing protein EBP2 n=1 Tax=Arachis hypogaea TaxID=3818 RepID=A0A444XLZ2_ARAHY|nr:hypothetical protein Ahy_B09g096746 isoform A [Arachis hypogaea]